MLPMVMPNPHINITVMGLFDWVTALVNEAADDYAELFEVVSTNTGAGGIHRIPISPALNKSGLFVPDEFDGWFVDPVAIADLTVADSMLDLTPILEGDVDWWARGFFYDSNFGHRIDIPPQLPQVYARVGFLLPRMCTSVG